jgi:hypothetical protein
VNIFSELKQSGLLTEKTADELISANQFLEQIFNMLRLCSDKEFNEASAPEGLKKLLFETVKEKNFEQLRQHLLQIENTVHNLYVSILGQK